MPAEDEAPHQPVDDIGPAIDETIGVRRTRTPRRDLEYGLFAIALATQLGAIALRLSGDGYANVVLANRFAVLAYLLGIAGVFVRYRGWDTRVNDPRNHTYYLLTSPLAGVVLIAVIGTDPVAGFTQTAVLVPGLIAGTLSWGWAHNSRMAPRAAFVEATETARGVFWGWVGVTILTGIQLLSEQIGGERYVIPELLTSMISIGAFLLLVSTGYTQYIRAQEELQDAEEAATGRPVGGA